MQLSFDRNHVTEGKGGNGPHSVSPEFREATP